MGLMSLGGVEPVVRTIERAIKGKTTDITSIFSLQALSNAFNCIDRGEMATAIATHAPKLYHACK